MQFVGLVVETTANKVEETCGVVVTAPQETETVNDTKKRKGGRQRKN